MYHRVRQAATVLLGRRDDELPAALGATPRTARLFAALDPHDRRHLVDVHRACIAEGLSADIAMAGLLHDIGKASLSGRRVNLLDRSLRVILTRFSPRFLRRWSREPSPSWRVGLHLAEEHARLGASRIAALGWSDSVVGAVREHESTLAAGELATLQRIDDSTA